MSSERKQFLVCSVGEGSHGQYAFHVEGNVTKDITFFEGAEDKKSMLSTAIAIGRNAWSLLGETEVRDNPETQYVDILAFGAVAKRMHETIVKGSKIVICGRPQLSEFEKKDGTIGSCVKILVDGCYPLSCKTSAGGPLTTRVSHMNQIFTKKDGTRGEVALACLLGGTVKKCDEVKEVNGQPVISFDLELELPAQKMESIVSGTYSKEKNYGTYKIIRCNLWGKRARSLTKALEVGNTLAVTGIPSRREYNEQTYINMNVKELSVITWAKPAPAQAASQNSKEEESALNQNPADDDMYNAIMNELDEEEYELPF